MGARNPRALSAQRKRYRMKHGERVRASIAQWRAQHPGYGRAYFRAHRGELNLARRARYGSDEAFRSQKRAENDFKRAYWRSLAFAALGEQRCARCGCDDLRILEVNHKPGTPKAATHRSGIMLWKAIATRRLDPAGFNLLCKVCNIADYVERKWPGLSGACSVTWTIPWSMDLMLPPISEA
jgi:hypothetical protein